jgi:hypothetical protein
MLSQYRSTLPAAVSAPAVVEVVGDPIVCMSIGACISIL